MTRMAIEDEKEARYYNPVANISKRDYMGAYGVLAFIIGTITFAAIFIGIMAALFNSFIENIDQATILMIGMIGLLSYFIYVVLYIAITRRRAAKRYDRGRAALVKKLEAIKELEEIYIEEEENRSPTISMEALNEALPVEALSAELPDKTKDY